MSKEGNLTCKVCGKKYNYCPTCPTDTRPKWMKHYCGDNCKKIFSTLVNYSLGEADKDTTMNILLGCDLSNQDSFDNDINEKIIEVFSEDAEPVVTVVKTVDVPHTEVKEDVVEEVTVDANKEVVKNTTSKKNKRWRNK